MNRTGTLDKNSTRFVQSILKDKCGLTAAQTKACTAAFEQSAEVYREQVERYGKAPDKHRLRNEIARLRDALKVSASSKDFLMYASWQRIGDDPSRAVLGNEGKSVWEPGNMMKELDAYAEQVENWLGEAEQTKGGQRRPLQLNLLVKDLASTYESFTGKRATGTPSGAFYDIVSKVFFSLGIPSKDPRERIDKALKDLDGKAFRVL
jgi:hypothetical protein